MSERALTQSEIDRMVTRTREIIADRQRLFRSPSAGFFADPDMVRKEIERHSLDPITPAHWAVITAVCSAYVAGSHFRP